MYLPERIKKQLHEDTCVVCCGNVVTCMSKDFPKRLDVPIDLEIDREGGEVLLRHIIKDDPDNPLTIEYSIDKNFVEEITKNDGEIVVYFVDEEFREEANLKIKIDKEDLKLIRREVGLGS